MILVLFLVLPDFVLTTLRLGIVDILPILNWNACLFPTCFLVYLMHHSIFYSIPS